MQMLGTGPLACHSVQHAQLTRFTILAQSDLYSTSWF